MGHPEGRRRCVLLPVAGRWEDCTCTNGSQSSAASSRCATPERLQTPGSCPRIADLGVGQAGHPYERASPLQQPQE